MAQDDSKVLKIVADKVEIGIAGTGGTEPVSYVEVGFFGEKVVEYKIDPVLQAEGGGGKLQKAGDCSVKVPVLQFLDGASLETSYKNKKVWLKVTPTGTPAAANPIVRFKNFLANFGFTGDLSPKGESLVELSGTKLVSVKTDFMTEAAS